MENNKGEMPWVNFVKYKQNFATFVNREIQSDK